MIVFLLIALALSAVMLVALGWPLLKAGEGSVVDDAAAALAARLAAIERDRAAGLISIEAAEEAAIEAKRGALLQPQEKPPAKAKRLRFAAIIYLALAPLIAGGVYMNIGAPGLINPPKTAPAQAAPDPNAIAAMNPEDRRAMIEQMVGGLAARLEQSPDDPAGWRMLANSQMVLGRPVESAESYRRLFAIDPGTLDDWRNFAGALAASDPQTRFPTDDEFLHALDEIDKRSPGDLMTLFYRGGALRAKGDYTGALDNWKKLLAAMPEDAPVRPSLESLITETEAIAEAPTKPEP
ncbi:MAG: c-type cytochrome biogenesis protein CcmI [Parvularculaceae bacterium]